MQELKDPNAKNESTCNSKSMRGGVNLPVVDPLDGAIDSEGLTPPDSVQGMVQRRDTTFKQQELTRFDPNTPAHESHIPVISMVS